MDRLAKSASILSMSCAVEKQCANRAVCLAKPPHHVSFNLDKTRARSPGRRRRLSFPIAGSRLGLSAHANPDVQPASSLEESHVSAIQSALVLAGVVPVPAVRQCCREDFRSVVLACTDRQLCGRPGDRRKVVNEIASYGKQIGWLNEVILGLAANANLPQPLGETVLQIAETTRKIEEIKAAKENDALQKAIESLNLLQRDQPDAYARLILQRSRASLQ